MGRSVFVSYSSKDRSFVEPLVRALEARGLEVWWDQKIHEVRWDKEIETQLNGAYRVLAVLTENAVKSQLDFVFAEMRRAREQEKLVPLRIGSFDLPFSFDGVISLVQTYNVESASMALEGRQFDAVCRSCGWADPSGAPDPAAVPRDVGGVHRWFGTMPSPEVIAFAIALAVLEHMPLAEVRRAGDELARVLQPPEEGLERGEPSGERSGARWREMLTPRGDRVRAIGAEIYTAKHPRLGVPQECCRFTDPERGAALLLYVWQELDQLQEPITRWLEDLAERAPWDVRLRIALAMGRIAQVAFSSVLDRFLRRWAVTDAPAVLREVADVTLSVACFAPGLSDAVKKLVHDWSRRTDSTRHLQAAVALACGYTGMRIPRLSIEILKAVAEVPRRDFELVDVMQAAVGNLFAAAAETGDSSLLELPQLFDDLAAWVRQSSVGRDRLPMLLFLRTMDGLPLSKPSGVAGVLSLADVVANARTRQTAASVLSAALRDPGAGGAAVSPREWARQILLKWATEQRAARHAPDPVLALVRELLAQNGVQRDQDRILHLFWAFYPAPQLGAPTAAGRHPQPPSAS